MVVLVGYYFFVPSISGRTNRAYFRSLNEAIVRAKINGATSIYYTDEGGADQHITEVTR